MSKYQWQGEPVKILLGHCKVKTNKDKPLWWYNFECEIQENENGYYVEKRTDFKGLAFIEAVKVIHSNGEFIIANHYGIGVHKLINGGWPNYQHFSLDGEFEELNWKETIHLLKFDEEAFSKHEAERRKWQKENFPIEFEKMEQLRLGAQKYRNLSCK